MKLYSTKPLLRQKRTWAVVAVIVCMIAAIGVWIVAEMHQAQATKQVNQEYTKAKTSAKLVAASSSASREDRLAAIEQIGNIQSREDCKSDWWNAWHRAVLPSAKAAAKDCKTKIKRLSALSKSAAGLNAYLKDDYKVAKTLAVLKVAKGSDSWQKTAVASTESALKDIEAVAVTHNNKALLDVSKDTLLAIINAWDVLNKASSKEDRTAYLAAKDELAQAYANLGAISDTSDKQVEKLVKNLQSAASTL